ncbi:hypothetical protein KY284_005542 [Solanum tuberosum]|nr:hypothetical protein KY284_005542 [Solanum tuberosum]
MDLCTLLFLAYLGFIFDFVLCAILVYEVLYQALKRYQRRRQRRQGSGDVKVEMEEDEVLPKIGSTGQRNATRCGLWWAEMLKDIDRYKEAASVYFRITGESLLTVIFHPQSVPTRS